ncbi:MAG TPA: hypothetical protein VJV03_02740 [Pyrinomonadaceae bacterium]|nr:hypothetical protein [Pyrinomonadaceae bacterium]
MARMNELAASGGIMSSAISEVHAYRVSAYIAAAISPSNVGSSSFAGYEIWNKGWSAADAVKLRERGIEGVLESPSGAYKYNFSGGGPSLPMPFLNNALDSSWQWTVKGGQILK